MITLADLPAFALAHGLVFRMLDASERRSRGTTANAALFNGVEIWRGYNFPITSGHPHLQKCVDLVVADINARGRP